MTDSTNPFDFDLDDDFNVDTPTSGTPADTGKKSDDDIQIPKARFDAETKKLREENDRLAAQLKQNAAPAPPPAPDPLEGLNAKLDTLEEAYEDAMIEGDKTLAKQLRGQLRDLRTQISSHQQNNSVHQAASVSREETAFQQAVSTIEAKYPMFNSADKAFDAEATQDVLAMMAGFTQRGMSRAEALRKAVDRLAPAAPTGGLRDAASRGRNMDASRRQPPSRPGIGSPPSDEYEDIARMSPEEIAKLDVRKLSVLRGDYLE